MRVRGRFPYGPPTWPGSVPRPPVERRTGVDFETDWARPFRGGAAYLSMHGGFPVVPVHLDGTGRVLPKGAKRPARAAVHVTFGSPLRPREGERTNPFAERIEEAVTVLADERATDWWTAKRRAAMRTTPSLTGPDAGVWRRSWVLERGARKRPVRTWP